jgi:5-methylcytosine-specific restriction enzyme subunit McrC
MTSWIELQEHQAAMLAPHELDAARAETLHGLYGGGGWLEIEGPSPRTGGHWSLRAGPIVGALPLPDGGGVRIAPKVPLHNIFRMLEVAYASDIRHLSGTVPIETLDELFDRLAARLTTLTLQRVRRGLAKEYHERADRLPYVRGRLDVNRLMRAADHALLDCEFDELTVDIHDNHVLVSTLHRVARSPAVQPRTRAGARRALYGIGAEVSHVPVRAASAVRRHYDRLRRDYRPMHVLCRLLLEHAGPTHRIGAHEMTAFVIQIPRLFELFVANDLARRLPPELSLATQERLVLEADFRLHFEVDLVLTDRASGRILMVLDTKYKDHRSPSNDDLAQIVTYAVATGAETAALVYPTGERELGASVGHVRVRRLGFDLGGDLEVAGERFAAQVIAFAGSGTGRASDGHA